MKHWAAYIRSALAYARRAPASYDTVLVIELEATS